MKKYLFIIVLSSLISLPLLANRQTEYAHLYSLLNWHENSEEEYIDSIIPYKGYRVHIIENKDNIDFIGLNLFNDDVKNAVDKEMLDFVETALLGKIVGEEINGNTNFLFFGGDINKFKKISPESECRISNLNSQYLSFEWNDNRGNTLRLDVPIIYDNVKGGSRGEIEEEFIKRINSSSIYRDNEINLEVEKLIPYGENEYVLPGQDYINKEITRNLYLLSDSVPELLFDKKYPCESIANLFIYPIDQNGIINIDLTILKHEYGDKELISVGLENFLALCEDEGCLPYWGTENYDGETLYGSLFLYNWKHGYDHVLKIECKPEEVIEGTGSIKARASLFIPTNNVQTLFEPYRTKNEDEKIKYLED